MDNKKDDIDHRNSVEEKEDYGSDFESELEDPSGGKEDDFDIEAQGGDPFADDYMDNEEGKEDDDFPDDDGGEFDNRNPEEEEEEEDEEEPEDFEEATIRKANSKSSNIEIKVENEQDSDFDSEDDDDYSPPQKRRSSAKVQAEDSKPSGGNIKEDSSWIGWVGGLFGTNGEKKPDTVVNRPPSWVQDKAVQKPTAKASESKEDNSLAAIGANQVQKVRNFFDSFSEKKQPQQAKQQAPKQQQQQPKPKPKEKTRANNNNSNNGGGLGEGKIPCLEIQAFLARLGIVGPQSSGELKETIQLLMNARILLFALSALGFGSSLSLFKEIEGSDSSLNWIFTVALANLLHSMGNGYLANSILSGSRDLSTMRYFYKEGFGGDGILSFATISAASIAANFSVYNGGNTVLALNAISFFLAWFTELYSLYLSYGIFQQKDILESRAAPS